MYNDSEQWQNSDSDSFREVKETLELDICQAAGLQYFVNKGSETSGENSQASICLIYFVISALVWHTKQNKDCRTSNEQWIMQAHRLDACAFTTVRLQILLNI